MDAPFTSDDEDLAARIADVALVRTLLIAAAQRGEWVSYSQALADLGTRFTRPKMRALCKTLGRIDQLAEAAGEPELAVLVVREGDGTMTVWVTSDGKRFTRRTVRLGLQQNGWNQILDGLRPVGFTHAFSDPFAYDLCTSCRCCGCSNASPVEAVLQTNGDGDSLGG